MNWKAEAIEKLQGYAARQAMLTEIPERIRQLESSSAALRAVAVERIPSSGDEHSRETGIINSITIRDDLALKLENARLWVRIVDNGLSALDDEQRLVLDRFYIHRQKGAVDRLCEELFLERNSVYKRGDEALWRFTMALYGAE